MCINVLVVCRPLAADWLRTGLPAHGLWEPPQPPTRHHWSIQSSYVSKWPCNKDPIIGKHSWCLSPINIPSAVGIEHGVLQHVAWNHWTLRSMAYEIVTFFHYEWDTSRIQGFWASKWLVSKQKGPHSDYDCSLHCWKSWIENLQETWVFSRWPERNPDTNKQRHLSAVFTFSTEYAGQCPRDIWLLTHLVLLQVPVFAG